MGGEEEVVVVAQNGHGGVPYEVQERLKDTRAGEIKRHIECSVCSIVKWHPVAFYEEGNMAYIVSEDHSHFPNMIFGVNGAQPVKKIYIIKPGTIFERRIPVQKYSVQLQLSSMINVLY